MTQTANKKSALSGSIYFLLICRFYCLGHLHITLQAYINVHFRIVESFWRWNVSAIKSVIKLDEFGVFERNRSVFPHVYQFTDRRPLLHCAIFFWRENVVEHPCTVKLNLNHILIKLEVMCNQFAALIGGVLEIKECDIHWNTPGP